MNVMQTAESPVAAICTRHWSIRSAARAGRTTQPGMAARPRRMAPSAIPPTRKNDPIARAGVALLVAADEV